LNTAMTAPVREPVGEGSDALQSVNVERFTEFLTLSADMVVRFDDLVTINEKVMERAEQKTRLLASRAQRDAVFLFTIIIGAILALSTFYPIALPNR
jgi:hypothetical protein